MPEHMKFMSLTFPDWTFHVSHYLAILIIQELHADLGYLLLKEKKTSTRVANGRRMNECMRGIEKWSVVSITYLATRACPSNYLHHDGPAEVSKYFRRVFHKTLKPELSCSRQSSTVYKKRTVLWDPARRLVLREICTMRKVNEMACIAECHLIAVTETTLSFLRESRR